jgi:glyoxalase family protein
LRVPGNAGAERAFSLGGSWFIGRKKGFEAWLRMQLTGIHHVTAVTAKAARNHAFYTDTLGLRLVKKTVNQDDVSAYHLFYADGRGSPGTDLTFFDWPATPERRGNRSITRIGLRVASADDLAWWQNRFAERGVKHQPVRERDGRATLDFEDFEGQRMSLIVDGGRDSAVPWEKSPVPFEHQIRGLGPVTITVPALSPTERVLTQIMAMRRVREYPLSSDHAAADGVGAPLTVQVFEMGAGGPAAELHVAVAPDAPAARLGAGGVHHVAFRVPTYNDYEGWARRLEELGMSSSGPVNRHYFRSLYFREPGGVLFELATDGPGFAVDEPLETMGENLSLPPFLEHRRREIETNLKPLETAVH